MSVSCTTSWSCFPSEGLPRGNQGSTGIQAELHRLSGPSDEGVGGESDRPGKTRRLSNMNLLHFTHMSRF